MTDINKIAELIKENYSKNGCMDYAIRSLSDDENYQVGDQCRESYEWDYEDDISTYNTTGETAGGTCGTHITNICGDEDDEEIAEALESTIKQNQIYGDRQIIICGKECNNDGYFDGENEIRIIDAFVLAIL